MSTTKPIFTILYYTGSREDPQFEAKIINNLKTQAGEIPIVSVSQKPLDLGKNICVGDIGHSYLNMHKQIYAGLKHIKTDYVAMAESDFLYPPGYFSFQPKDKDMYRYDNVWIVFKNGPYSFRRKRNSEGASYIKREFLMTQVKKRLDGILKSDILAVPFESFGGKYACVSFKTGSGVRSQTNILHGRSNISTKLPYWGYIGKFREEYL